VPSLVRTVGISKHYPSGGTVIRAVSNVSLSIEQREFVASAFRGEQVVIARAMVNDPALILADEPTGALDNRTSNDILSLFENFHRDGRTIIVVTHAAEVADRARRQITLHDGRIIKDDAASTNGSLLKTIISGASQ
jgi:putative ABC transport system ATP-binding protein